MKSLGRFWVIVLAAGDGKRVRDLTRDREGRSVPKQFSTLRDGASMLRCTIERAAGLVPRERIVTVVAEQHRQWWALELADLPLENVIVQPQNRGTAAGILLPFQEILRRDPSARFIVLPSDHHVADEGALREAILEGIRAAHEGDGRVVLLGMEPGELDGDCGWIVPGERINGGPAREVAVFVEKPAGETARFLKHRGALLNSFILVATGTALLRLFRQHVPRLFCEFAGTRAGDGIVGTELRSLYEGISSCDFSREVLELEDHGLAVLPTQSCGWSDLGTPDRLRHFRNGGIPQTHDGYRGSSGHWFG